jgi:phosphoribosylformylglycinamidine synthase
VGIVGALPDPERAGRLGFADEGDAIAIVGELVHALDGSELAKLRGEPPSPGLPIMKAETVRDAHATVRDAVRSGALKNAHDIAEGGLAVALAECCAAGGIGARVELGDAGEAGLFGEAPGAAFVVSGPEEALRSAGMRVIGRVGGDVLELTAGDARLKLAVGELITMRESSLLA